MPTKNVPQLRLALLALIVTTVGVAFWLGRLSVTDRRPPVLNGVAAGQGDTIPIVEDQPVPIDPMKLDYKTLRIANTLLARQIPMTLYSWANHLAWFEKNEDAVRLRDSLRSDLRIGVFSLAASVEAWGVTDLNERALRQVSTYYATTPDPELDARATAFLSKFPPLSSAELAKSGCGDGICTLARSKQTGGGR